MRRIKITETNRNAILAALQAVNGMAARYTITQYYSVELLAKQAERLLDRAGVPKRARIGARFICQPAGPTAGAWRYGEISTRIVLERDSAAWFLVDVQRVQVYLRQPELTRIEITEAQRDAIVAHALNGFSMQDVAP